MAVTIRDCEQTVAGAEVVSRGAIAVGGRGRLCMATIMVVDDDANIRTALKYSFERENYDVQLASNGLEALGKVGDCRPDLILLDIMMPEMNGVEFLSHLRQDPQTEGIPVIMLSATKDPTYHTQTQELGALCLLPKPFSPRRVVYEVQRTLSGGECCSAEVGHRN
jgi:CheY-like chemotaxis protein